MIKEVVIVEGKNDYAKLKEVFKDIDIITTNGSEISSETLDLIENAAKSRGIIIFTDPDYPGTRIRQIIQNRVPDAKHAFIKKAEGISKNKKKVGIEHASNEVIRESIERVMTPIKRVESISKTDLFVLGLIGNVNSNELRGYACEKLNLGHCNGKTLLNRLNLFGIDINKLKEVVDQYEGR